MRLLGGLSNDLTVFTGNGTESDNGAITIALHHYRKRVGEGSSIPRIIASSIEHPGILKYLSHLESTGSVEVRVVPVNDEGNQFETIIAFMQLVFLSQGL